MKRLDLTGQAFGHLHVVSRAPQPANRISKRTYWECRCNCGTLITVSADDLKSGNNISCGCVKRQAMIDRNTVHGHRIHNNTTSEYWSYRAMMKRCYQESQYGFKWYGGRGITVCDRWKDSFLNFLADMGPKPGPQFTIERLRVNGNYEPANCIWLHESLQARNRRPRTR